MRILFLAHRIPFPPNKGDKIRSYHHVQYLARRHELHLLCFVDEAPSSYAGWEVLRDCCASVELIPLHKQAALVRGLFSLARGRSLSEGYFGSSAMRRAVMRRAGAQSIDLAWAYSSTMAQYLPLVGARRTIADFVDVDSEKWRQYGDESGGVSRPAYHLEAARMRAFENRMSRRADAVLFVSPEEATLFRASCPPEATIAAVPNGVDTEFFAPDAERHAARPTLLFTGALDYRPNIEAVLRAAREIVPLVRREIPTVQLLAVGHRPARELTDAAAQLGDSLRIAGSVPDVRPYFAQASVYVAPLRLGRGVQNKILEAMAMRVPVVASPVAFVGIDVRVGEHVLACNSPAEFSDAICSLLRNPAAGVSMANAAAALIAERYQWSANLRLLDQWTTAQPVETATKAAAAVPPTPLDPTRCHA